MNVDDITFGMRFRVVRGNPFLVGKRGNVCWFSQCEVPVVVGQIDTDDPNESSKQVLLALEEIELVVEATARCEVCGNCFVPVEGYYEAEEYSYCRDCCQW